jgi:predicted RNA-binding Zn ribbon-like protein
MPEREEPSKREPAPKRLNLVREFINSNNIEDEVDDFATAAGLGEFLKRKRLPGAGHVSESDRRKAVELREALRALVLANNGGPLEQAAINTLNRYGDRLPLVASFARDGSAELVPAKDGVSGALALIVAHVYAAMEKGSWHRLKACQNRGCHWAFYDHSKNQSGRWCTMRICGNRAKARAYVERRRKSTASAERPERFASTGIPFSTMSRGLR